MSIISDLLAEVEGFLTKTGMPPTTFGKNAVRDGKFVARLRAGKGITVATVDRVRAYIASQREAAAAPAATSTEKAA
ncbi:MAG: hypothetical protein U1E23_14875 [Reyranellaceae bacterium]